MMSSFRCYIAQNTVTNSDFAFYLQLVRISKGFKFFDRHVWADNAVPFNIRLLLENQSDQGLDCWLIGISLEFPLEWPPFGKIAAHSVDHMFSLYFDYL